MRHGERDLSHRHQHTPPGVATTTLLSSELRLRLQRALRSEDHLVQARSADEFQQRVLAAWDHVAVLEPGHDLAAPLCDGHVWTSGVPIIAYTRLTAPSVAATLRLTRAVAAPLGVLIAGYSDQGDLRARLSAATQSARGGALYERLAQALQSAPTPIQLGIREFCCVATARDGVPQLARHCAISRAALARWLGRCGIRSARDLIVGARLVRGYDCLVAHDVPLGTTATLLCLGTVATLRSHVFRVAGQSLEAVRDASAFDDFVARVAATILGNDSPRCR